jgi:hypothetical protein
VFLAELLYERSKSVLTRLNVKSLPLIFHWGPESVAREGRSIKLPKASKVGQWCGAVWLSLSLSLSLSL